MKIQVIKKRKKESKTQNSKQLELSFIDNPKKKNKNVWGYDLKAELPKNPDITQINRFNRSLSSLSKEIFNKIKKIC